MSGMYGTTINCRKIQSEWVSTLMRDVDTQRWPSISDKMPKAEHKQIQKDEKTIGKAK